ncbi:hypothetical protein [Streptomyces sp. NPDC048659]|uniref:hypothetical protein n=1 Tax=Streptomyces sp. NPDC048659 TaxID=3155489 RepID=UPI00343E2C45
MRPHAVPRLTALAISAVLTLGTAGPAFADEARPALPATLAGGRAPLPDAAALLAQAEALGDLGSVSTPVTELITAALKVDGGQLPAADADALKKKIDTAVDAAKEAAPAPVPEAPVPGTPAVDPPPPAAPTPATGLPAVPTPATGLPAVPTPAAGLPAAGLPAVAPPAAGLPAVGAPAGLPVTAGVRAAAPADVVADALAGVQTAVAGLLAAVTSGDAGKVVPQVTSALTSLVNLAVATVLGGGLPAPDLAGLPALPSLAAPALPVEAPVKPPVDTGALPIKPPLPVR